ncbi:MAG: dihydrolipoyl dehydrogenase [Prevotellaceae bacterium]|jgi:dihydrolipoamide dehydrogenase|nr:dihydrolipoyl dehydrogenase [Prevotellaceae bacterium]
MQYDLIIIGSGPGGYVAAIRASQLGMKTAIIEKAEVGGICLNWGCIPTKALLKSVQVFEYAQHAAEYGIEISGGVKPNIKKIVERSRGVAAGMSKGVDYLLKKNKIDIIQGFGKLAAKNTVEVSADSKEKQTVTAKNIILATGARSRVLPSMPIDGKKIIGYRQALVPENCPKSMVVVGSGAIGSELAYFYNAMGTQVTLVEYLPNIVPLEDEDVSAQLSRSFRKAGIKIMTGASTESVDTSGDLCKVRIQSKKGTETVECEVVLSAVGISANIEGIGLEELGIEVECGKIKVDKAYRTNVEGIYAIGDIINTQALAHVASAEAIACVEKLAGLDVKPINYNNIPGCTYTTPEIASVGYTEKAAIEKGYEVKVGKFPYTASGKANAAGARDGFVKLALDAKTDEVLGAHFIGANVTEMIGGIVMARNKGIKGVDIIKSIFPHPTMSEAIMEAATAAYGEVVHL